VPLLGVSIPLTTLVLAVSILLAAGIVKGTLGFGVGLVSATLLIQLFPPKPTLLVLILPIGLAEVGLLINSGIPWKLIRDHVAFFLLLVPGAIAGVLGLVIVPVNVLYLVLSGYIVVFLAVQRYEMQAYRIAKRRGFGAVSGIASGLLGGSIGAAGPPTVPYLYINTRDYPRSVFVGGMAAAYIVPQIVRLPPLIVAGRFGSRKLLLESLAAAIVLVGLGLGTRLRPYIPEDTFEIVVKTVLLVMAVQLASDAFV
jgi:uncharacterized membrane protein YfcA